jgi:hypothetical protein
VKKITTLDVFDVEISAGNGARNMISKKIPVILTIAVILISASSVSFAEDIRITAKFAALPVLAGLTQKLEIKLPPSATPGAYDTVIEAETEWGILLFPSGPARSGHLRISPGKPAAIEYRWSGASPVNAPVTERIDAHVPELGISGEVQFYVGVDVRISDVKLPEKIQAGAFNSAEIFVADAFNAEPDLPAMFESLSVQIETAMTLTREGAGDGTDAAGDPVIRAFFAGAGGHADSYPSDTFVSGTLSKTGGGKFIWTGTDGRIAGITPPSPGRYHIEAVLKPNIGGPPLRHWSSPSFTVSANAIQTDGDMPALMASTLSIIAALDREAGSEAMRVSRERVAKGDVSGAIAALGRSMRQISNSPENDLGRYSAALGSSGRSADEIVNFMGSFVKGYDYGVLIFTSSGVAEYAVKRNSDPAHAGNSIFEGAAIAAAPFSIGHDMTLLLKGAGTEDVSLWKLIPQGVNAKKYPRGKWIKEITVNTTVVTPPNAAKQ